MPADATPDASVVSTPAEPPIFTVPVRVGLVCVLLVASSGAPVPFGVVQSGAVPHVMIDPLAHELGAVATPATTPTGPVPEGAGPEGPAGPVGPGPVTPASARGIAETPTRKKNARRVVQTLRRIGFMAFGFPYRQSAVNWMSVVVTAEKTLGLSEKAT